jgi:WD40 repeat protein/tRNA A-37 threonylcarbamoyl transferase component Bud32
MSRNCPSQHQLVAFHQGTLAEDELDAVAEHLEACPGCEAAVQKLDDAVDPVVAALRKTLPDPSSLGRAGSRPEAWRPGTRSEAAPNPAIQSRWPSPAGYEILAPLGHGGMGMVYRARHLRLNRLVALKQLRSGPREAARARTEAEALARLQHPNIVQIYEVIEHQGQTYLALELIEGGSLGALLRGKPQSPQAAAALVATLARTVHYAHTQGIIHRDLKPANILLAPLFGDEPADTAAASARGVGVHGIPKIADFGLAKLLAADSGETQDGDVIGTASYMSPEQAGGKVQDIGPATDVYSLGVILYELITGRVPLQGPTSVDTLILVRNEEPVPPRCLQPSVPRDLETVCLKCLHKDPGKRYASAKELADDLRCFLEHRPIWARATPAWERAWKWAKRRPLVTALSAAVVLVAALGFALVAWQWRRAEHEAEAEGLARQLAQERERGEVATRRQLEKLTAGMALDEGTARCEKGEVSRGLLLLAHALQLAHRVGDAGLERVARCNLAGWQPFQVRLRGRCQHHDLVMDAAFSRDGNMALTGSLDRTACLWDAATGRLRGRPLRHPFPVWAVALSPDGKTILTGGGEASRGEARLWDAASGKTRPRQPEAQPGLVYGVLFSPDGRTFLTVCPDQVCLWRTADARRIGPPLKHPPPAVTGPRVSAGMDAVFSPDSRVVITGGADGTARFWDAATGQARGKPLQASGPVAVLTLGPDGRTLLVADRDGAAQLWDVATGERRGLTMPHPGRVMAAVFSPDGTLVATGCTVVADDPETGRRRPGGGEARLWRAATGQPLGDPLPHPAPVWSLAFSPGGRLLLTGCQDAGARFFAVATGLPIGEPLGHEGTVRAVAFSPDGTAAVTAAAGGDRSAHARIWDVPPEHLFPRPLVQGGTILSLAFSPDSQSLLTGTDNRTVQHWEVATGRPLGPALPQGPTTRTEGNGPDPNCIVAVDFSRDGQTLLTAGQTGDVRLWDRATGRPRCRLRSPDWINCAAFSPDGHTLLTGSQGNGAQFWQTATGQALGEALPGWGPVFGVHFSPDGRRVVLACKDGVRLWDRPTRRRVWEWKATRGWPSQAVFFPDGGKVVVLAGGFAEVLDAATGRELGPPPFHVEQGMRKLAFGRDGGCVLVNGASGFTRLWDVATGKTLGPPIGRSGPGPVAISPDGRTLAVGGRNGLITLAEPPRCVGGSVERVLAWVEVLTGKEHGAPGGLRRLTAAQLRQRRRRLQELGGPPPFLRISDAAAQGR